MTRAEIVTAVGPEGLRRLRELLDKDLTGDFTDEYIRWANDHGASWVSVESLFDLLAPGEHARLQVIDFDSEFVEWIHKHAASAPFPGNLRTYTFFRPPSSSLKLSDLPDRVTYNSDLDDRELETPQSDALYMYDWEQSNPSPTTEPLHIYFKNGGARRTELSRYDMVITWIFE